MASTRRDATVTPSTWPSERLRVSRGSRGGFATLSFDAGDDDARLVLQGLQDGHDLCGTDTVAKPCILSDGRVDGVAVA